MNRYRNAPGARGPSKATASTLCQKCLKRDNYECKSSAQERPYMARPSRTQQLQNPKLRPQLTTDTLGDFSRTKGLADDILAKREEERGRKRDLDESEGIDNRAQTPKRARSASSQSVSSVSTVSTNKSRSASPRREQYDRSSPGRAKSPSSHHSWSRKRRHSESPAAYSASSYSSGERTRSRSPDWASDRNTRRRRRESSPKERGRARNMSHGSDRGNRSRSRGMDKGRTPRGKRSITPEIVPERVYARGSSPRRNPNNSSGAQGRGERGHHPQTRRERSLSPYSKRLALTQAMNLGG